MGHDSFQRVQAIAEAFDPPGYRTNLNPLIELSNVRKQIFYSALFAMNSLDCLDAKAQTRIADIKALPTNIEGYPAKLDNYIPRLWEKPLGDLGEKVTAPEPPAAKGKKKKQAE